MNAPNRSMDPFPAHIEGTRIQSINDHSRNTARYASSILEPVHLQKAGYLSGLLHDLGKYSDAFSDYIQKAARGESVKRGSVNHTFAGVRYLIENYHNGSTALVSELLAYAAGAHHGLFDLLNEQHRSGFKYRVEDKSIPYAQVVERFNLHCASKEEIDDLFTDAEEEITPIFADIRAILGKDASSESYFYMGLLSRLLLSAVIEGDRRDTAEFTAQMDRQFFPVDKTDIWEKALASTERYIDSLASDTPIGNVRQTLSDRLAAFASEPPGIYRLHIPTGGGKTLSSFRYALRHALRYRKAHVFYVAPLISILEQNASVLRSAAGCDEWVLEHHSNVVNEDVDGLELDRRELLQEDWQTPIIVTTLVQLLNALFEGRTASIRRFHALTNSVIIFDEVQSVPQHMLSLFNLAVNFLSAVGHTTVLLCSATQPCLEETKHPMHISPGVPVALEEHMHSVFARTEIRTTDRMPFEALAGFVRSNLSEVNSLLAICNTIREAEVLTEQCRDCGAKVFYLSATLCMAHRRAVLEEMVQALDEGTTKVLCISTPVIEAGVDISFDRVLRLCAGMDSIVQAAGRCNRNGALSAPAPVFIVRLTDEKIQQLRTVVLGKNATEELLYSFQHAPSTFANDLSSDESIRTYYRALFRQVQNQPGGMDFPTERGQNGTLYDFLSCNPKYMDRKFSTSGYIMPQAFQEAGKSFCVIENNTVTAIAPYGRGAQIIEELKTVNHWELDRLQALLSESRQYSVSLYRYTAEQLLKTGQMFSLLDGTCFALMLTAYSSTTGLQRSPTNGAFLEV